MPATQYTPEDQLVTDLVDYWTTVNTVGGSFTADATTDVITTDSAHGRAVGDRVRVITGEGLLPTPLEENADYYVLTVPDGTTFTLGEVVGGTPIDITAAGGNGHLLESWVTNIFGIAATIPVIHFRQEGILPIPAIIVGHEGCEREKGKGMIGTGHVALRIALRTDMDVTSSESHRAIAAIIDRAVLAMNVKPGPLDLSYIHGIFAGSPDSVVDDRRQITVLRYTVVTTRMEPVEE